MRIPRQAALIVLGLAVCLTPSRAWATVSLGGPAIDPPSATMGSVVATSPTYTPPTYGATGFNYSNFVAPFVAGSSGEIQFSFDAHYNMTSFFPSPSFTDSINIHGTGLTLTVSNPSSTVSLSVYGFWTTSPSANPAVIPGGPSILGTSANAAGALPDFSVSAPSTSAGPPVYLEMLFKFDWKNVAVDNTLNFDPPPLGGFGAGPDPAELPEPSTVAMGLTAVAGVGFAAWRKRKRRRRTG